MDSPTRAHSWKQRIQTRALLALGQWPLLLGYPQKSKDFWLSKNMGADQTCPLFDSGLFGHDFRHDIRTEDSHPV